MDKFAKKIMEHMKQGQFGWKVLKGVAEGFIVWVSSVSISIFFVVVFAMYMFGSGRLVVSNDGSHYALLKAICEDGTFAIDKQVHYTFYIDLARKDGHFYTDRPPGTAFLGIPFYFLGKGISLLRYGEVREEEVIFWVLLLPVLAATGSVYLLYHLARRLGATTFSAWLTAAVFAFGTINWKYATVLFSHSLSAFLILLSALLLFLGETSKRDVSSLPLWLALGLSLGVGIMVEFPNLLVGIAFLGTLLWWHRKQLRKSAREIGTVLLGVMIPLALVAWYHHICFGQVLVTAFQFHYVDQEVHSLSSAFRGGMLRHTFLLLFGLIPAPRVGSAAGILTWSPVLFFSLWGWRYFLSEHPREGRLYLLSFGLILAVAANYKCFYGGGTGDGRYLLPVLGFGTLPLYAWADRVLPSVGKRKIRAFATYVSFSGALLVSFGLRYLDLMRLWGHHPLLEELRPFPAQGDPFHSPAVRVAFYNLWQFVLASFPNRHRWEEIVTIALLALVIIFARQWMRNKKQRIFSSLSEG